MVWTTSRSAAQDPSEFVGQERPPGLGAARYWLAPSIASDRSFADDDAQLEQLAANAFPTPQRGVPGQVAMRSRTSAPSRGRPSRVRDFHVQYSLQPLRSSGARLPVPRCGGDRARLATRALARPRAPDQGWSGEDRDWCEGQPGAGGEERRFQARRRDEVGGARGSRGPCASRAQWFETNGQPPITEGRQRGSSSSPPQLVTPAQNRRGVAPWVSGDDATRAS
jgi:hypothetical protein